MNQGRTAGEMDVLDGQSGTQSLGGHQQPVRPWLRQRGAERVWTGIGRWFNFVEAGQSSFHAAQALL